MTADRVADAESALGLLADRLRDPPTGFPDTLRAVQLSTAGALGALVSRAGFDLLGASVRWPGHGDTLVVRRRSHALVSLEGEADGTVARRAVDVFHDRLVVALRPLVEDFFDQPVPERVRRRLSAAGFRVDWTRRRWTTLVDTRRLAVTDRVDVDALDAYLTGARTMVGNSLGGLLYAAAAPRDASPRDIGPLRSALLVAPDHVLLRAYLRHRPEGDLDPGRRPLAIGPHRDGDGPRLVIAYRWRWYRDDARWGYHPVAAYDLDHAHPTRLPETLRHNPDPPTARPRGAGEPSAGLLGSVRRLLGR